MKKFLALLLATLMVLSLVACGGSTPTETTAGGEDKGQNETTVADESKAPEETKGEEGAAPKTDRNKDQLIYGSNTEISGDWASGSYWTNNATDNMIRGLIDDYGTVTTNKNAEYIINPTVCEGIEGKMNDDKTKTFTVKIAKDLTYNNGDKITAKDFVFPFIFFSHPTLKELGAKTGAPLTYVGGEDFNAGKADVFSGIRLIDEYTFSVQVNADKVPYFYELTYAAAGPVSIKMWLGDGYEVKDDGKGAYISGDMSKKAIEEKVKTARFQSEGRITAGPYNLVKYDVASKQATLEINDKFKGNFEGKKPAVKRIIIVKSEDATQFDALATGSIDMLDQLTGGDPINKALDLVKKGGFATVTYDRAGYGKLMFQCDFGPTQFLSVRHAIAYLLDRQEFANKFTGGYGAVVNGPYGIAQWQYQEAEETLNEKLNEYPFSVETAIKTLEDDGWNLDKEGKPYKEGVRYKEVTPEQAGNYEYNVKVGDKTLMPLIIEWASTENNPVSELLATMLAKDTAPKAGVEIRQATMTFEELLNWMYRNKSVGEQYGVPKYGMYNLATNFNPIYDMSYSFTSKPDLVKDGWNVNYLFDEKLDDLSMKMVYGVAPTERDKYLQLWTEFIIRWNELLPEVPLYSNIYYTIFRDDLKDYEANAFWGFDRAIVYAHID